MIWYRQRRTARIAPPCVWAAFCLASWAAQAQTAPAPVVLDHVVAVVNNQVILASEIDDEVRLSVLEPDGGNLTRTHALDELISRALIQQQIPQEDAEAAEPSRQKVEARLADLRRNLPACVRAGCASDDGWKNFLAGHGLTPERVESYIRYRIEILNFIEQRFRQGIRISAVDIEKYYRETLLPQYKPGETVPPLEAVSKRIEEILLQQQVNALFDDWLNNLRTEGDVEVTDPAYEALSNPAKPEEAGS